MCKYMIDHHKEIIAYLTVLGSIIGFGIGLYKWLDVRKREVSNRRFEQFHKIFEWVAGRTANGTPLVDTQQAMAVYELAEYPEYKHLSLPIIDYYLEKTKDDSEENIFKRALTYTNTKLNT